MKVFNVLCSFGITSMKKLYLISILSAFAFSLKGSFLTHMLTSVNYALMFIELYFKLLLFPLCPYLWNIRNAFFPFQKLQIKPRP